MAKAQRAPSFTAVLAIFLTACTAFPSVEPTATPKPALEVPVTTHDLRLAQNSPMLAADPGDSRVIALAYRIDAPDFNCALQMSGDAGRTWVGANPVPSLPPGAHKCYAPEVAFDEQGRLYYLFLGLRGRGNLPMGAFLSHSDDRGRSFSAPLRVLGPLRFQVRMVIDRSIGDRGRLHLVWLQPGTEPTLGGLPSGNNPIMAAYSDDAGRRFSKATQVSAADRERIVAPAVALGADHSLHVAYYDLRDDAVDYQGLEGPTWAGMWSIVSSTSQDGGLTFSRHGVIEEDIVPPERVMLIFTMAPPAIAADGDGNIQVAWTDAREGDWDVLTRRSLDDGKTWAEAIRINDDARKNGRHQYLPRLSSNAQGRVDAVFYDRRNDLQNLRNDAYYAFLTSGRRRFSKNVRITRESFDSRIGTTYPIASAQDKIEIGSGLGLISDAPAAVAAWTDTRNSILAPQQDIFTSRISFPGEKRTAPVWVLAVVASATFAMVVFVFWKHRTKVNRNASEPGMLEA